jgi:hypothetical protein
MCKLKLYEVASVNKNYDVPRYFLCSDNTEALRIARLLRLWDRAELRQGGRKIGEIDPLIPSPSALTFLVRSQAR